MRRSSVQIRSPAPGFTRVCAELMGWSDILGTLTPGKEADVVLLDGNPLEGITAARVRHVFKAGQHSPLTPLCLPCRGRQGPSEDGRMDRRLAHALRHVGDHVRCEDVEDQMEEARLARQVNRDASLYLPLQMHGDTLLSCLSTRTGC